MSDITTRLATASDAEMIIAMLSNLVGEISDQSHFHSTRQDIETYGFGDNPIFQCFVAEQEKKAMGLALFFPVFSTDRGKPGVYVQDLWVSKSARGKGLGRKLLTQVINHSAARWQASYLTLMVHDTNIEAKKFYQSVGFSNNPNEMPMALDGKAFTQARNLTG